MAQKTTARIRPWLLAGASAIVCASCGLSVPPSAGDPRVKPTIAGNPDDRADEKRPATLRPLRAASESSNSDARQSEQGAGEAGKIATEPAPAPSAAPTTAPPAMVENPAPNPVPVNPPADPAKYGVNKDMTCGAYIAKYWKVGAFTLEEYKVKKFLFSATLTMRSTVTAVNGAIVTVHTEFDAPGSENDQTGDVTFDACNEGHKLAIPNGFTNCNDVSEVGFEDVSAGGKQWRALRVNVAQCTDAQGKTLQSSIWRSPDVPLWGIVKRDARGSYISDEVDNRLAPTTSQFSFN